MHYNSNTISLVVSEFEIKVCASYFKGETINSLEIDAVINLGSFFNSNLSDLNIFAVLKPVETHSEEFKYFYNTLKALKTKNAIVTAISIEHPDFIFTMYSDYSSTQIIAYIITIKDFIKQYPGTSIGYINGIKGTIRENISVYENILTEYYKIIHECESLKNICNKRYEDNQQTAKEINEIKGIVCQLAEEFTNMESMIRQPVCINCKTELVNVLFIPCGHFIVCHECLYKCYKTVPNLPIAPGVLRCMKCNALVTQALNSIKFSNCSA